MRWFIYVTAVLSSVLCDSFNLPAYEYIRRFQHELDLGQCANRVVQYPDGPVPERCPFLPRSGETVERTKVVETQNVYMIRNASDLIRQIGLCDEKAASYFGLLVNKKECIVNEVARKLSFKDKAAVLMYRYYYRPRLDVLVPSLQLDGVPPEFTHYLNGSYYTINRSIGREDIILMELQYKSRKDVEKVYADTSHTNKLSRKLASIAKKAGLPRRVKVITVSTADFSIHTESFKGKLNAMSGAVENIQKYEESIAREREATSPAHKLSHLAYGFKAYEVDLIPYAAFTVIDWDRKQRWEEAALLQVEAEKMYKHLGRYKKMCRSLKTKHEACRPYITALKTIRKEVTNIHNKRRDWTKLSKVEQLNFVRQEPEKIQSLNSEALKHYKALREHRKLTSQ